MKKFLLISVLLCLCSPIFSQTYCTPSGSNNAYFIKSFSTTGGTTNITNNNTGYSASGYGNFTSKVVTQEQGETIDYSITAGSGTDTYIFLIWVDWNKDGDFADAGELVYDAGGSWAASASGSFTVPISATIGSTRMRIGGYYMNPSNNSCATNISGEFEDYTFTVTAPLPMSYKSSQVIQTNFTDVGRGATNSEIIAVNIVTTNTANPISATSFSFVTTGTTNPTTDIENARLWYTGNSNTFATTTQVGSVVVSPNGTFVIPTTQTLLTGNNYFWLTYDIKPSATLNNYVDAVCSGITVGSIRTPSPVTVTGSRKIQYISTIGTGNSTQLQPFQASYGYARSASLYDASEIGVMANITHLAWDVEAAKTTNIPIKIYLKSTIDNTLTTQTWDSLISGATLVYNGTVQFATIGWNTIDITDFTYCNNNNIIVLCESNFGNIGAGASNFPSFKYTTTLPSYRHEHFYKDNTPPTDNGTLSYNRPNIKILKDNPTFCSGTPTTGTISASPTAVTNCTTPIILSSSGYTATCGMEYQWQWSIDNTTWTNIPNGNTIPLSTTILGNTTYYRLKLTCNNSGSTIYSSSVQVTGTYSNNLLDYNFSATSGSYSNIIAGTTIHAADVDDACSQGISIGFSFNYACNNYSSVSVSSNGWLSFNSTTGHLATNNLATSSYQNIIAPLWDDLKTGPTDGQVRYKTTGSSPNRVFTVEWYKMKWNYNASGGTVSFQVKLYETSNKIEFIYKKEGSAVSETANASVGINGPTSGDYYSLNNLSASPTISKTVETITIATLPANGQKYTWTPLSCAGTPNAGTISASPSTTICKNFSATLNASGYTLGCDISFKWQSSTDEITWADVNGCNFAIPIIVAPTVSTYYRLSLYCANSGLYGYSNSILIEINEDGQPNDLPCDATPISIGGIEYGNNSCASGVSEPNKPSCWNSGVINAVWYSFVAPASGSVKIKTQPGSLAKTQIALYSGNCNSLTEIACNDNMTTVCPTIYYISELLASGLIAGQTYYIRVDGDADLTGTFSLLLIEGTKDWPRAYGQDCGMQILVCSNNFTVGNPGYQAIGNYCDFTSTNICLGTGDRGSVWYYVPITTTGDFNFVLTPNDFNPSGPISNETDYDFAVWRIGGHAPLATCASIFAGDTTGGKGPLACNYNTLGITGCSPLAKYSVGSLIYNAGFQDPVAVIAGDVLLLNISNFTNSTSGFNINFTTSTATIAYPDPATVTSLTWTGGAGDSDWFKPLNWGDCNNLIPSSTITAIIPPASSNMPIIDKNGAECKSLIINAMASCGVSSGYALSVYGDIVNYGLLNMNSNSDVFMRGTANQILEGNFVNTSSFWNFTVNKTGVSTVKFLQDVQVNGNLTTSNANSVINANGNLVMVGGSVILLNSTFTAGTNGEFRLIKGNAQNITTNNNIMQNFTMQKTANSATILNDLNIAKTLSLKKGVINTNAYKVICTSSDAADIKDHNVLSYINGNLRKYFAQNTNTYSLPMGTALAYRLVELKNNNLSGITYLDVKFVTPFTSTGAINGSICQDFGTPYSDICPEGVWQIDPNAVPTNGSYDIYLWFDGGGNNAFAGLIDNGFGPAKRPSSATLASAWTTIPGSLNVADGLGRLVSHGYALRKTITSFSQHAIAKINTSLPVTISNFKVNCLKNGVELKWSIESEINAHYYLVQKSEDQKTFKDIGKVYAQGNANHTINYTFVDEKHNENSVYRLMEFDFDGSASMLGIISSNCKGNNLLDFKVVYDIHNASILATFNATEIGNYKLQLFDISGSLINTKNLIVSDIGKVSERFNTDEIADGVYTIILQHESIYESQKIKVSK